MLFIFSFLSLLFCFFLETLAAQVQLFLPLSWVGFFFLAVYLRWQFSLPLIPLSAQMHDSLLLGSSLLIFILLYLAALYWRHKGDCHQILMQSIPVSLCLLLLAPLYLSLNNAQYYFPHHFGAFLLQIAVAVIPGSLIGLACFFLFEHSLKRLELLPYSQLQRQDRHAERK